MGTINMMGSLRYSMNGKRRKTKAFSKSKRDPLKSWQPKPTPIYTREDNHREKYPSVPMSLVDNGEGRKKETMKYTGTLVKGIATMHKSNAVPVIDDQHAIDIAKMRR